ncbi:MULTISPECIES: ABC transporter substrate-binding protein [Methanocalculus]|uniref:ABC transporter substrate-binding protein n=1 Tax=Methanocalculus TaxID=71151 RepID=UPI00209C7EA7|nr:MULTISPECIES: cobalamin-binding protein [unclassified Methanocalculus]MCP1661517.1 iron complex transport system substrate-binding protein [Methanocalculus sp. AMF5]
MRSQKTKSIWRSIGVLAAIMVLCTGVGAALAPEEPAGQTLLNEDGTLTITVPEDAGHTIPIDSYPDRIVSLAPSNTELLFAIGAGDRLVAVADQSDYPAEAHAIPTVGGYRTVSLEKVVAAKPDLVVATSGNSGELIERLRRLGFEVVVIEPETMDGILDDILLLGRLTGNTAEAKLLTTNLDKRIQAVTDTVADRLETPSVAHIVWHDPVWVSGDKTFQHEVITRAGGTNAFESFEEWEIIGLEEFVIANPDYILVNSGTGMDKDDYDIIYEYVMNEPRFQRMNAVKQKRVIIVDADTISRGGPRIVDALEEVADVIHPDLFTSTDRKRVPVESSPAGMVLPLLALIMAAVLAWKRT